MSGEVYGPGDRDAAYAEAAARIRRGAAAPAAPEVVHPGAAADQRRALAVVGEYVCEVGDSSTCTCAGPFDPPAPEHEPHCGTIPVIRVSELEALGFKHDDDAELQRRALRAVQRYAQYLPPGVRDVIREALGQTRPEWNRPALRAELVDTAVAWAAARTVGDLDTTTKALVKVAERYRLATTVDHEPAS